MISVLTLNRNQTQIIFDSLIRQLIHNSIIAYEDVITSGLKIWVVATNTVANSSTIGGALLVTHSHFLNNLLRISKNY